MPTSPGAITAIDFGHPSTKLRCYMPQGSEYSVRFFPVFLFQDDQFCRCCHGFIKQWCRSAVQHEFCFRHRHCAYLHPRCKCSDPTCWKDHPHNYKICVECRHSMRAMASKKHGLLQALLDDDAHVVALLEASPQIRNKLIKAGELKLFADIGNSIRKLA